jgi:DNA-binding winged helix-turn-helix (wHTH) protein/TolB-like protein/Tfp pilus assembly protein PilF
MSQTESRLYEFGGFVLDATGRVLLCESRTVHLTPKAFDTLLVLVERCGQVVEKERLMSEVWPDTFVEEGGLTRNIHEIRKALGQDSSESPYIETIPKRGYRFVAPVRTNQTETLVHQSVLAQVVTDEKIEEIDEACELQKDDERVLVGSEKLPLWKSSRVLATVLSLVLLVGSYGLFRFSKRTRQPGIKTVAVLPLRSLDANENDPALGLKLADALIQRLARLQQVVVRPTRAVQKYEDTILDPIEAGREQQVDAVLDGSVQRAGERLHLRMQLLRVSDGQQLWEKTFDESAADPFLLQDTLAEQAAQALVPQLTGAERNLVVRRDTENVEANRLYTEARYHWNKRNVEGIRKSAGLLEQAIALDPNYARAHAALADSYINFGDYHLLPANEALPMARAAAQKALAIDNSLAEAYTALAMIKADYDWDWAGADRAFQQAIEKNPHYATAHQWYAEFLSGMGRHREALEHIHQAQQLDPLSLIIESIEALNLNYARDYDGAITQCQRVLARDRSFGEVYAYLGFAYEQKGMYREALDAYEKYSTLSGYNTPAAAAIRSAPVANANDYWNKMLELSKPPGGSKIGAAQAFAQLGETGKALAMLEQACSSHSYGIIYLKVHPNYDPLREDAKFQELLRRIGLVE